MGASQTDTERNVGSGGVKAKPVSLGEISTVVAGQSPPGSTYNEAGAGIPFFQGKADFGEVHPIARKYCTQPRKIAEKGDILISIRAPVGPANIASERCCIGRGLAAIRPDEAVALRDFVHWSIVHNTADLVAKGQGSTFAAIGKSDLESLRFPLPPLGEQRRIAGILNRAARIERLRARAAECLDGFAPALFARTFGDPADNPMGWPIVRLDELCKMDRQGLQPDDPAAARLPFLGVENVVGGTGSLNLDADSRVGNKRSMSFRFDGRHVLYAKLRPYLNKVATPGFTGRCSTELIPLLPRKGVNGDFLAHLLRHKETVAFVMKSVTGARMPRTDMKVLMSMPVPCPPADVQNRFTDIVKQTGSIADYVVSASGAASALTASLMDRLLD